MTSTDHALPPEVNALRARIAELTAALRASEDRTRLLLDSTAEAVFGLDRAGRCTFANAACARLLGYRAESELLGQRMHDLIHHTRADGSAYPFEECPIRQVLQTGQGVHVDDEVLWRADGRSFPAEYWAYPIQQDGAITGVVMTFFDIAERRQAEAAVQQRAREMAALYDIALEINAQPNLTSLLRTVVEKAAGLLGARMGGLYLMRPDGHSLELVVNYNLPGDYVGVVLEFGEGLSGKVAQAGQPLIVTDYSVWDGHAPVYEGKPFRRVLGVPLKVNNQIIGVINISDDQSPGQFTEEEVRLLTLFADQAAIAVMNARLYEAAQQELAEVARAKRVQTALFRISEAAHAAANLNDLYVAIHGIVNELMPARNFGIALYDPTTDTIHFPYFIDEDYQLAAPPPRRRRNGLVEYVLRTGEPLLGDRQQISDLAEREQLQPIGAAAICWLGVPLKTAQRTSGVVMVQTYHPAERLTEEHCQILAFVSSQIAMAIQRKRTEQVQASIYQIAQAALTSPSLEVLYHAIHQIIGALMPARNLFIALLANDDTIVFPYYFDEHTEDTATRRRRHGHGLTEYVLRKGEPLLGTTAIIADLIARGEVTLYGTLPVDWLGVPLQVDGQAIGVIAAQTYSEHERLTEEHRAILLFVSVQVAMVIQRRRAEEALRESEQRYRTLLDSAQRQAQELTLLDRVRTVLTRELDVPTMFRTVVTAIADMFSQALVSLYIRQDQALILQHQVGYPWPREKLSLDHGIIARAARTGQPILLEDVATDPDFVLAAEAVQSEVAVPLFDQGQVVGVLNVESTPELRLTESDLQLMMALGEHISSSISRTRLYAEARQNAARLRAAVESLPFDFWAMDRTGRYILQNSASIQNWGQQIGLRFDDVEIPAEMQGRWQANNQRAFGGEIVAAEATYAVRAEQRHFHEIIAPIWSEGEVDGIIGVNIDITDRRRAEEALRASEARLRAIIAHVPLVLFVLDRHGIFLFSEGKGLELLGLKPGEVVGRSVAEVYGGMPDLIEAVNRALRGESFSTIVNVAHLKFETWYSPLLAPDNELEWALGVAIDVTERERTASALRESEERYRLLFENNPHPMWVYDLATLAFLEVNEATVQRYGYTRAEFLKMTMADLRPRDDGPAWPAVAPHLHQGASEAGVWRHRRKDGSLIEVDITSHTLLLNGVPAEVVLATDVTERRQAEEALRHAQKMESLGVLAGGIAHDFNNLLVGMLGQTSLALKHLPSTSPARPPIEKAVMAARRAADLTRQLLAYSGRGQFERRPIHLNRLIQENLHLFEVAVPKHVTLRSELTEPLPYLMGDAGQVQQVVMNLIINAAEALSEQAGEVVVRTRTYQLGGDEAARWQIDRAQLASADYVLLAVEDNGCGMDPATLAKMFDPFFTTKFTGRGLGLAAVLGIVRGHQGGLRVTSEVQRGTTFELIFPGLSDALAEPTLDPELVQEALMTQPLILVIDDEEPVRDAVTDILEMDGLAVITAPDGWAGVELYRERQTEVRLIILDLSMPGLNGEATLQQLRQLNPQIRILISSGYSHTEVAPRFAGHDAVSFIQKPYDVDQLLKEVNRQLAS